MFATFKKLKILSTSQMQGLLFVVLRFALIGLRNSVQIKVPPEKICWHCLRDHSWRSRVLGSCRSIFTHSVFEHNEERKRSRSSRYGLLSFFHRAGTNLCLSSCQRDFASSGTMSGEHTRCYLRFAICALATSQSSLWRCGGGTTLSRASIASFPNQPLATHTS